MSPDESTPNRARTKIVATVGPASQSPDVLRALVVAGVDVFRVNMAHGDRQQHQETVAAIQSISAETERPVGILVDLAGPKIRLGTITPDPTVCLQDAAFRFVKEPRGPKELTSTYDRLIDELELHDRVLLADGTVEMIVTQKDGHSATCRVTSPGEIRSRQGINLPGVKLTVPTISETDRDNAEWAAASGIDFIGLSFVRKAEDILELKEIIRRSNSHAMAIAKIEKPEALASLDDIVAAADGIMVARGDLGVEIDVAKMPVEQKRIIQLCRELRKPVIVATQMLDSMQRASRPTRAEVTDVANAILDGTDACMLSGETAIGKFPVESVCMMNRIMCSTENSLQSTGHRLPLGIHAHNQQRREPDRPRVDRITSAVVRGAGTIAEDLDAKIVVIATRSGATALAKSSSRDFIPTIAVSDRPTTLRQMTLLWGIEPLARSPHDLDQAVIPFVVDWGRQRGILQPSDRVVFVAGTHVRAGAHNQLIVHEVE